MEAVKINALSKSFGGLRVLKDLSATVEAGEYVAIIGPNGAGKTTLLNVITGALPASSGRIYLFGSDITGTPAYQRAHLGLARSFQINRLFYDLTVLDNVLLALQGTKPSRYQMFRPAHTYHEIIAEAQRLLEGINLWGKRGELVRNIAYGEQRGMEIVLSLAAKPRVLLLDEPLSNLDANLRIQMRREILELQRKLSLTTIFVTHDQEEANTTSDRIAVLNDGIIQQVGSPMELYDRPANRFVANFLGSANLIDGSMSETEGTVLFRAPDGTSVPLEGVGAKAGENITVMFRPQNLIIRDAGAPPAENRSKLSGQVQHREFLGNIIRYAVNVGEQSLLVDDTHQTGHGAFDIGADVALYLSTDQVRLLPN